MARSYDQTMIEDNLIAALKAIFGTTYKIYPSRPTSVETTNDAFIVAKVSGQITDWNTHGHCTCSVHLFAKDLNGIKNTKKLSKMYSDLIAGLPETKERLMFGINPAVLGDTPDDYGYHARIINISTTIKAL